MPKHESLVVMHLQSTQFKKLVRVALSCASRNLYASFMPSRLSVCAELSDYATWSRVKWIIKLNDGVSIFDLTCVLCFQANPQRACTYLTSWEVSILNRKKTFIIKCFLCVYDVNWHLCHWGLAGFLCNHQHLAKHCRLVVQDMPCSLILTPLSYRKKSWILMLP